MSIDTATITNTVRLTHKIGDRVPLRLADGDSLSTTVTRAREPSHTAKGHYRMICAHGTVWWTGDDVWWLFRPSETPPERHARKAGHRARIAGEPRQAPRHYMEHASAWVRGWDDGAATIDEAKAREARVNEVPRLPAPLATDVDLIVPLQLIALAGWTAVEVSDAWFEKGGAGIQGTFTRDGNTLRGISARLVTEDGQLFAHVAGETPVAVRIGLNGQLVRT